MFSYFFANASKRCRTILAPAIFTLLPLVCAHAAETVEITVAHPYGKIFRPIHQEIIKEFNKIHPNVKVTLETPYPDYEELTQRTLAGVAQNKAPVLSFQGINQIRQYVEAGYACDLSNFVKNDPRWREKDGYYPTMMALGNFNGKQYAIPFAISTPIVYYNGDLLKKAGINPDSPPATWDDLIKAAKKIQGLGPEYTGMFYDYQATGNWMWQALLYSEGGSMMDERETRVTIADPAGVRAAKLLRRFIDEGVMKDWTRLQGEQAFIAGRVGFYAASTSWLKGVQDKTSGFEMRTGLFPPGTTGRRYLPNGGNGGMIITKDPARAKAAYEYAMFAAGPVGTAIQVRGSGYMPMHVKGTAALKDFYEANPNFRTSLRQIPMIFRWYSFPGTNTLKIIDVIKDRLQAIVGKKTDPEEGIKAASREVAELLKK
ncbi:MAG: ABC transporter substrate-binding protein [Candidatus Accumulibacter sp.]|nr:ABC transporter substrate-binding protein [Accumulibacter sp.]